MAKNTYAIALVGIYAHELRILQTICSISKSRPQSYVLEQDPFSNRADVTVVDQDSSDALGLWQRIHDANPSIPAIMLTRRPTPDPTGYQLARPLMATRLLKLLDQILDHEQNQAFTPSKGADNTSQATEQSQPERRSAAGKDNNRIASLVALVVDDSLPVRQQMQLHLSPLVDRVDMAEDGEQAIEFISDRSYDIVFLDVVLPGMDGYKICRAIKRNKSTKNTPVIMLTGKSSPFDMVRGKLAGCDTYLTKPVDDKLFNEVVHKYLSQQQNELNVESDRISDRVSGHL